MNDIFEKEKEEEEATNATSLNEIIRDTTLNVFIVLHKHAIMIRLV